MSPKFTLALLIVLTSNAFAGVLIEPYLGYMMTKTTGKIENYGTKMDVVNDGDINRGSAFGARLGYGRRPPAPAPHYMGTGQMKNHDVKTKVSNLGVTAMVGIPFIRAWVGYIVSSQYDVSFVDSTNQTVKGKEKGSGYKAGFGFSPLPLLSFNVEWIATHYDKETYTSFQNVSRNNAGPVFSISLPLVF